MGELSNRRSQTQVRLATLKAKLQDAEAIAAGKACVYVTGSYGRGEASVHSDLDLFIVSQINTADDKKSRLLTRLDEIRIKAKLIDATRDLKIEEFSGDGRWLDGYSVEDMIRTLGKPEDDALNTFTARLLLLLESQSLLEKSIYDSIIQGVISPYWRDFEGHEDDFVPAFLTNDIIRLWRTFCVNYEASTLSEPTVENAKRKSKNYKLKHSRMLTCYSAVLYLLAIYKRKNTVSPGDVIQMSKQTPTQRLEWLLKQSDVAKAHSDIKALLDQYDEFLATTNIPSHELTTRFLNKDASRQYMKNANEFGKSVFGALNSIGDGNKLHRLIVV